MYPWPRWPRARRTIAPRGAAVALARRLRFLLAEALDHDRSALAVGEKTGALFRCLLLAYLRLRAARSAELTPQRLVLFAFAPGVLAARMDFLVRFPGSTLTCFALYRLA